MKIEALDQLPEKGARLVRCVERACGSFRRGPQRYELNRWRYETSRTYSPQRPARACCTQDRILLRTLRKFLLATPSSRLHGENLRWRYFRQGHRSWP